MAQVYAQMSSNYQLQGLQMDLTTFGHPLSPASLNVFDSCVLGVRALETLRARPVPCAQAHTCIHASATCTDGLYVVLCGCVFVFVCVPL